MSCFWTDLVGATQDQCSPAGLRLAFASTASEEAGVETLANVVAAFQSAFVGGAGPRSIAAGLEAIAGGDTTHAVHFAQAAYRRIVSSQMQMNAPLGFTAGFTAQPGRFINTYAEFLAPGQTLTVAGAWIVTYDNCPGPLVGATITAVSAAGASASIDGTGLLAVTPPTAFTGGSLGSVYDLVLRITGTVNGEIGASEAADFYLFDAWDFCF